MPKRLALVSRYGSRDKADPVQWEGYSTSVPEEKQNLCGMKFKGFETFDLAIDCESFLGCWFSLKISLAMSTLQKHPQQLLPFDHIFSR